MFAAFARLDLKSPDELEADEFSHIDDATLRRRLSEVFYGVRWIYKLGLALLAKNTERAAHVRAQIVDYASVSEALLVYCLAHAIRNGYTTGTGYGFKDPDTQGQPINWNVGHPEPMLRSQACSFWWMIRISREFGIINTALETDLHVLRKQRNAVHLQSAVGKMAFLNQSKGAYDTVTRTIRQTKAWKTAHP